MRDGPTVCGGAEGGGALGAGPGQRGLAWGALAGAGLDPRGWAVILRVLGNLKGRCLGYPGSHRSTLGGWCRR